MTRLRGHARSSMHRAGVARLALAAAFTVLQVAPAAAQGRAGGSLATDIGLLMCPFDQHMVITSTTAPTQRSTDAIVETLLLDAKRCRYLFVRGGDQHLLNRFPPSPTVLARFSPARCEDDKITIVDTQEEFERGGYARQMTWISLTDHSRGASYNTQNGRKEHYGRQSASTSIYGSGPCMVRFRW